ncbi:hypothetical protein BBJ28_00021392 [Nothophytophthora sp. Chile5]|nr:hypothetical protein BBJ28_00021392 [Nothophytophthora sp. Chile5]
MRRSTLDTNTAEAAALDGSQAAAVAVCDLDGRIQLEFASEDDIELKPLRNHATVDNIPPQRRTEGHPVVAEPVDEVVERPPVMCICIIIVGTRGDVQPFLAIAQRLQQDGHRVRLATHAVYRDFVVSHGVEFYPLGGDPKELAAYMVKTGGHLIPTKIETLTKDVPRNKEMINEIVLSTWPAVSAVDPDGGGPGVPGTPFQAQAIIANPVSYGHIHVAERLGVPLHIMFPQPWVPTMAFPHPLSNMPYTDELKKSNYLSYKMVDLLMWQGTEGIINSFRTDVLKLRKIRNGDGGRDMLLDLNIPHAFMWSPKLVPKPADWGDLYDVIGTVSLKDGPGSTYNPSPELEAFLGHDGGPIFVGFGSMMLADPLATTKMIIEAALQANVRVLIQSSWSDMAGDLDIPSNVFFLGNCPHDWLMPRVSAVVHHGGAGTTAAGLLAGKPTFIVPFFGDQPFWGHAVVTAGVGVEPCPIAQLTSEKLREAFVGLMNPTLRARVLALRDAMRREDGAGEAVRCFYRHLPTQDMWCDLDHERIATHWSVRDRLKLCDRCALVVGERPENQRKKMVSYHCVDYTARGPDSTLAGASSGTGAFFHEIAGAYASLFRQPVKGFVKSGVAGGAVGIMKGYCLFLFRPTVGLALFTDRVVTGHINAHREEGHRKQSSMFDRRFMAAIGVQKGLADTYTSATEPNSVDTVLFPRKHSRKQMLHRLSDADVDRYRRKYEALMQIRSEREAQLDEEGVLFPSSTSGLDRQHQLAAAHPLFAGGRSASYNNEGTRRPPAIALRSARLTSLGTVEMIVGVPSEAADAVDPRSVAQWEAFSAYQQQQLAHRWHVQSNTKLPVPVMNICLATIGTWDNGVKQFTAIGVRLASHGHRVRLAANERFRSQIVSRGLEFYPLAGAPESTHDFASLLHDAQATAWEAMPGHSAIGALQAFKELIYSLWPAAYGSDPHGGGANVPGDHFRADALLWHPLLLGHAHVAQRLGIPLQCASLEPLSPTFTFPHLLSSILGFEPVTTALRQSNLLSHGVVDAALCHGGVAYVLAQFRAFIGLTSRFEQPNPLVEWEVPHIYLYNPTLLPKPLDWGVELAVTGHVTLKDAHRNYQWPRDLNEFVSSACGQPVIYFGVCTQAMAFGELEDLVRKVDAAAQKLSVRVVFQTRELRAGQCAPYRSNNVHLVASDMPYTQIFPKVTATTHWGEPDILAEGLGAGKPVAVCGSSPSQHFAAHVCERARVGIPLIDPTTCTVESLAWSFHQLLQPGIREDAKMLARSFNSDWSLGVAVEAFYANLPLAAMRCDVDSSKIARVFDPRRDLKLSLEAYLAVHPLRDESKGFVPYKPLVYDGSHPPTFSIRGNPGEIPRDPKPPRELDAVGMALEILGVQDNRRSSALRQSSVISASGSVAVRPVNTELFWTSRGEEEAVRQATNAAYERLVKPHQLRKRDKLARLFGAGQITRASYSDAAMHS